ncbi:unnamed protein product [Zymoseptoria tritici ST99CH_1A5]|uniref:F-box domain-containing protein n=1 Tax=Zymoseptoria tritici ST99CH_1A5 TaxID=1276529 RepID=A0A1Y6LZH5_ZYMTR|nr:unnamed protein product [Zymoseptoria tritici ST99CH_1A5]
MTESASLSGLPTELLERIAQYTGGDIRYLRLTSRHIAAQALGVFRKAYFTDLTVFLATESSLRKAVDVIGHQALGPTVRKLVLVDDLLSDWKPSWGARSEPEDAIHRAQSELHGRREDIRLLTELFRKCGRSSRRVSTIHYQGFIAGKHGPWREEKEFDYDDGSPLINNEKCFVRAMNALVNSGAHFESFTMDTDVVPKELYSISMRGIKVVKRGQDDYKKLACTAALHRFETLDLTLEDGFRDEEDKSGQIDFLSSFPHAKVRTLNFRPSVDLDDYGEPPPWISPSVTAAFLGLTFPAMQTLTLRWIRTDWGPLLAFLKRQTKLRKLNVFGAYIKRVPKGMCMDVFRGDEYQRRWMHQFSCLTGIAELDFSGAWEIFSEDASRLSE